MGVTSYILLEEGRGQGNTSCMFVFNPGLAATCALYMYTYLCSLPGAGLPHQDHALASLHHLHELGVVVPHGQQLALLQDLPEARREGPPGVLVDLQPCWSAGGPSLGSIVSAFSLATFGLIRIQDQHG